MRKLSPKKLWMRAQSASGQAEKLAAYLSDLVKHGYITVNLNGYYGGKLTKEVLNEILQVVSFHGAQPLAYPWDHPKFLVDAEKAKQKTQQWIERPTKENFLKLHPKGLQLEEVQCWISGRKIYWHFNGETFSAQRCFDRKLKKFIDIEPFPFADGHYPAGSYTIPITSGKLALFQWIEDPELVKDLDICERKVGSEAGRIAYSKYFEKSGFWHLFVGGHGRELYQKEDEFLIFSYNEENSPKLEKLGWNKVGEISFDTDLRWFTACDASKLKPAHFKKDTVLVLNVQPGNYTLQDLMERQEAPEDWVATFQRTS